MSHTTKPQRPAARSVENQIGTSATPSGDRLLDRTEANRLLGLKGNTTHTLRAMASRGQIEAVRLNARVLRFRESSLLRLINGRVSQ
jgi:hypothetical protein